MIILFLSSGKTAFAQQWEFGGLAGASGYMGDMNLQNPFKFNDWSVGAFAKYNINTTWGVRGNIHYLNIRADDSKSGNEWFRQRNLKFSSSLWEISAVAEFDFFNIIDCNRGRKYWQPYLFAGAGVTSYNPKANNPDGEAVSLREERTEGQVEIYGDYTMVIPFGVGVKYKPSGSWVYGVELGYRVAFTDYLDDVSGVYPSGSPSDFSDPSGLQLPGTMRGDGHPRDGYMFIGLRVSYILFNKGCPVW